MQDSEAAPLCLELDAAAATLEVVGGKGAALARMAVAGLPVPPGYHVTTAAYRAFVAFNALEPAVRDALAGATADDPASLERASAAIQGLFEGGAMPEDVRVQIGQAYARLGTDEPAVAVRSSGTAEDLPATSFAGQHETYLNVRGTTLLLDTVQRCWASLWTARAIGYRLRMGIDQGTVAMGVVVQTMVRSEVSGVLFTANPTTGARDELVINASYGLGEAVVGGQVTPDSYRVDRASLVLREAVLGSKDVMIVSADGPGTTTREVPATQREQQALAEDLVRELSELAVRVEAQLGGQPQDIEWAVADGRCWLLQARPLTGLPPAPIHLTSGPPSTAIATEEWNDSLAGDYLWTNANLGEAIPDVMTPCTWSLVQMFMVDAMATPSVAGYRLYGNIGGRFYMNLSLITTLGAAFGQASVLEEANAQVFGRRPGDLEIPLVPISRWRLLQSLVPIAVSASLQMWTDRRHLPAFLAAAPQRADELRARIQAAARGRELLKLWHTDVAPYFHESSRMLRAAAKQDQNALITLRRDLVHLVGEADANALATGLHAGGSELASLGPLVGLARLARGEIDRDTFARQYGHRSPHEFEVSTPRPAERPDWVDAQLAGLRAAHTDVAALLARQEATRAAAWERFRQRYPDQVAAVRRRIDQWAAVARDREAARSEVIRAFWVLRTFVQRAGVLTGQEDGLYVLSIDEILAVLGGDDARLASIPIRRATYERYASLPPYPAVIRGRFDPFQWAADPQRRSDVFDARREAVPPSDVVTGFTGAAGVVEGRVHVLATPEEGDQLQAGEVLVTIVTNVGWTPLFPRAAAVVTDVGAPLSHAAIVARELGIPAVVGCGNATMRLHTGDLVRVDGGAGTVEVLGVASAP